MCALNSLLTRGERLERVRLVLQEAWAWLVRGGYVYDWITVVLGLLLNFLIPQTAVHPIKRFEIPDDPSLSYPHVSSTVSGTVLLLIVVLFPSLVFIICKQSWVDLHHAVLTWCEAAVLATGFKRWMNLIGRYRPDWGRRQAGNAGSVYDGRLAYPSGHAAYSFYAMTLITLYGVGRLRLFSERRRASFAMFLLCLSPMVLSTFIALSRVADYKHDFSDINAGMCIGMMSAVAAYSLNYYSPFGAMSGLPKERDRPPSARASSDVTSEPR